MFLASFALCSLLFEVIALTSLNQISNPKDSKSPFLSGNLSSKNQGFIYHEYSRSSETLNITVNTPESASQRQHRYGESKAIFEVSEEVNKALDNDTTLRIEYQRSNIEPRTSAIQFFVSARNQTQQFRINYVIGYVEPDFLRDGSYFIFQGIGMDLSTISVRPWETVASLNLNRNALLMTTVGVKLIDYFWEEPKLLSMSVTIDLTESYITTYYDTALPLAVATYQVELVLPSVIVCAISPVSLTIVLVSQRKFKAGSKAGR
jgi:hypothetical protein